MANEDKLIVGVWKLVSVMYEDQATKAMTPIMGEHPRGYQIATPDGRWLALATPSGRTAPTTDEERALDLKHGRLGLAIERSRVVTFDRD